MANQGSAPSGNGSGDPTGAFTRDGNTDKISPAYTLSRAASFQGRERHYCITENTAKAVNLTLDASSIWTFTADSDTTCLSTPVISGISRPQFITIKTPASYSAR
jgi:hypothetical protein